MSKTKISEYSTTPANNTDIDGVNIAEGCPPSGINNAIRTLMTHVKEWQNGSSGDATTFASLNVVNTMSAGVVTSSSLSASSVSLTNPLAVTSGGTGANNAGTARTNLGLGTIATQAANNVAITGGSISGVTLSSGNASFTGTPTAPTAAPGTNTTQIATTAFTTAAIAAAVLNQIYPVGSIYTNATNSTNPATLLGFGTWVAFGAGRVPVGFDSGNSNFNAAEKTGGSADAIVVSHTHSFSGSTDTAGAHQHLGGFSGINTGGAFGVQRGVATGNVNGQSGLNDFLPYTSSSGNHAHSVSGTTASTGSSGTNANLQPYITVFMWKRTA